MMVKDWLKEYQKMKRKLEYWHDVANEYSTYSSPTLKEDSVMSSHGNSAEATVELVINRRENALAHISQLSKSMDKRIQAISELDDVYERQILFYRYIQGLSWERVIEKIPYEERSVYLMHGRALKHIEKVCSELQFEI